MKKFFSLQMIGWLLAAAVIVSCSEDEDGPTVLLPKLDGFYIFGTNTIATEPSEPAARMARAVLDPGKGAMVEDMEGVYGKFLFIGANSTIQFAEVVDEVGTVYGAPGGGSFDSASVVGNVLIKDKVYHGTLTANAPAIEVAEEGLYYAYADVNTDLFVLMKVKGNMIGDATQLNWAAGTNLPMIKSSKDSTVFEGTSITLKGSSGYRYRFNDGWHVYSDPNVVTLSSLGVESYGTAWDTGINDVGFWLDNIPHKEDGIYTIRLKYIAATGEWSEKKIKTGNIVKDYSATQMGLFGNAYLLAPEDTAAWVSGEDGYGLRVPSKAGTVYTWTWTDVNLLADREFIFLENGTWGGLQIDYLGALIQGEAITNNKIKNAKAVGGEYNNFFVEEADDYDITLVINATTNDRTITITTAD